VETDDVNKQPTQEEIEHYRDLGPWWSLHEIQNRSDVTPVAAAHLEQVKFAVRDNQTRLIDALESLRRARFYCLVFALGCASYLLEMVL